MMRGQVHRAARAAPVQQDVRARLLILARRYGEGTLGLPSPFFPAPPLPDVVETPIGEAFGHRVMSVRFTSSYVPFLADHKADHHRWIENHVVHARNPARDKGEPRPQRLDCHN